MTQPTPDPYAAPQGPAHPGTAPPTGAPAAYGTPPSTPYAAQRQTGMGLGIVVGLAAAVVGAAVWALIVRVTDHEIGLVAVGVGLLVGAAVAKFGGNDKALPVVAAVLAIVGCLLGTFVADAALLAKSSSGEIGTFHAARLMLQHWSELGKPVVDHYFSPIDVAFFVIAGVSAFRLAAQQTFGR